jgi:hypothetical protein
MNDFPKNQMLGYCSACGVKVIEVKKDGKKASAKFMTNFKEQIIELSNKTIMRVGVCDKCKEKMVSGKDPLEVAQKIIDNHIEYWKNHKREAPRGYEDLKATHPNTDLRQFLRRREKAMQEKELNKLVNK